MNKVKSKELALEVLKEMDDYERKYNHKVTPDLNEMRKAINLLISELNKKDEQISIRVLSSMWDVVGLGIKIFEDSPLLQSIENLFGELWNSIPSFKNLTSLGKDWGKGDPI